MRALERRIEKLDKQIAEFPCTKPGHDTMFLFWIGDEPSPKDLALFEAIRDCENCQRQNEGKLYVRFMKFGRVPENSKPASREPEPITCDIDVHDGTPEPEPAIVQQEDQLEVCLADWLKDLRND